MRAGDLAELRAEVPQRFVTVRYRGSAPDWSAIVPRSRSSTSATARPACASTQDVDLAAMVTAAQRDADLVAFAYEPPTLSELFRQAVAA